MGNAQCASEEQRGVALPNASKQGEPDQDGEQETYFLPVLHRTKLNLFERWMPTRFTVSHTLFTDFGISLYTTRLFGLFLY